MGPDVSAVAELNVDYLRCLRENSCLRETGGYFHLSCI